LLHHAGQGGGTELQAMLNVADLGADEPVPVRSIRAALHCRDSVEVETPILQIVHGGAAPQPFMTHSNALDTDLYLRIAPELHLKRCLVGGMGRVFKLQPSVRQRGADSTHSPEFTMVEGVWGRH
jgi:lysyl-tRNA synthetase class 2